MNQSTPKCKLQVVKLSKNATLPTKRKTTSAGFNLFSAEDSIIPAKGNGLVKTDIKIKVPHGTYGRIAPKSNLAFENHIHIGAGVIDEDSRGNIGVVMFNHSEKDFVVKKGDEVAQLICEKISYPNVEVVNLVGK